MIGFLHIKEKLKSNKKVIMLHFCCWFIYSLYYYSSLVISYPQGNIYHSDIFIRFSSYAVIFYSLCLISLPLLIERRKIYKSILYLLLSLFLAQILSYANIWIGINIHNEIPQAYTKSILGFFFVNLYDYFQFIVAGCAYWFYLFSIRQKNEMLRIEKEYHHAEILFLRSQIDQHFLYNTLSLYYTNALSYSHKLANSILSLSDILRYSISNQYDTFVLFEEELTNMRALIEINQYRFNDQLKIDFRVSGNFEGIKIPYFSIMTLLENAFKHGDLLNDFLFFDIIIDQNDVYVNIKNKKAIQSKSSSKVGLENLTKRLKILLEDGFNLDIEESDMYFSTYFHLKNKL